MTDIALYRKLFVHRDDVYAAQQPNGAYFPQRFPLTDDDIAEHLAGFASYGVYVIRPEDQTVSYIVFDLDSHDENLFTELLVSVEDLVVSVTGTEVQDARRHLLLESSGNKGKHVWLFLSEPLPARQVRAWVESTFRPLWNARTNDLSLEVFPKQDAVDEGGFGNLVKLPFGVHAVSGNRSEVVPVHGWASRIEDVVPLDSSLVPEAPAVGTGRPTEADRPNRHGTNPAQGPSSPFPCVDQILYEGVGQGVRDNAMFHLALYLYGHAIPEDLAEDICLRANENFDPPLRDDEVRTKVRSAYRGRFQSARCGTDWLRDVCPGPCRSGWQVASTTAGELRTCRPGDVVEVEVVRRASDGARARVTVSHPDANNQPTFVV